MFKWIGNVKVWNSIFSIKSNFPFRDFFSLQGGTYWVRYIHIELLTNPSSSNSTNLNSRGDQQRIKVLLFSNIFIDFSVKPNLAFHEFFFLSRLEIVSESNHPLQLLNISGAVWTTHRLALWPLSASITVISQWTSPCRPIGLV